MLEVLLIEDDIIDQLMLSRLIKKHKLDCQLSKAVKIEEARAIMENNRFDLVICDLNLPDGLAFDLGPLIEKQPFILLSGHLDAASIKKAKDLGAIEVLQKSSDLEQLNVIQNVIESINNNGEKWTASQSDRPSAESDQFNIQRLLQIFDQNPSEVVNILELFLKENPRKLEELERAIKLEDRENIHFVAHKLKSNFNLLGLDYAQELAQIIVKESKTSTIPQLASKCNALIRQTARIYPEINAALTTLK